jgi:AsmA protein
LARSGRTGAQRIGFGEHPDFRDERLDQPPGGPLGQKRSLFPSLDLVAEDVGIAPSGAANTGEMAKAKSLRFGLQLSALFGGKVKMTEVTLIDPVIAVPQAPKAAKARTAVAGEPQAGTESAIAALKNLSLDKLVIKNGTLIDGSGAARGKADAAIRLEMLWNKLAQ